MDNFDGYTAQLSHGELCEPSSVHISTGNLCLSLCLALGACGAVTGSGEFMEQSLCASPFEGKWVSKVWAKNHLGCMSVSLSLSICLTICRFIFFYCNFYLVKATCTLLQFLGFHKDCTLIAGILFQPHN
jgi:hypothetical protein